MADRAAHTLSAPAPADVRFGRAAGAVVGDIRPPLAVVISHSNTVIAARASRAIPATGTIAEARVCLAPPALRPDIFSGVVSLPA
jgi:hypothetical protein